MLLNFTSDVSSKKELIKIPVKDDQLIKHKAIYSSVGEPRLF